MRNLGLACLALAGCTRAPAGPPAVISSAESEAEIDARLGPRADGPVAAPTPAEPAAERVSIGARLLDERYHPLDGGELVWVEMDASGAETVRARAAADRNGAVWLVVAREALPDAGTLTLVVRAPGHAPQTVPLPRARCDQDACMLGELVLAAER